MKSRKMIMRHFIPIILLFFSSISGLTSAGEDNVIEVEAEGSFQLADGYSNELAKSIALYNAKRKALTYYVFHEPVAMKKALNTACQLGDNTACDDLKNIKKVNEYNFGISAIE
jgi:hypothetical protein